MIKKAKHQIQWVDDGYNHVYETNSNYSVQIGGDLQIYDIGVLKSVTAMMLSKIPTMLNDIYKMTDHILNLLSSDANIVKETNKYINKETIEQYSESLHKPCK